MPRTNVLRVLSGLLLGASVADIPSPAVSSDAEVAVTLSPDTATELRSALANAPRRAPLQILGIADVAEYRTVVPVPMRDGVRLSANLILPRGAGPWPVILIRSPYDPASEVSEPLAALLLPRLVRDGYAIAIVNDRGTQWSEGNYHWLRGANRDGWDILEWVSHQPWATGKVGTFGCSSSAESQPPLATLDHPAHRAMVEMGGGTGLADVPGYHDGQGIFYHGGVPDLAWTWWYHRFGHLAHPQLPPGLDLLQRQQLALAYSPNVVYGDPDFAALAGHLPSGDILRAINSPDAEWNRLIQLTPGSPEWAEYDFIRSGASTRVPGLHIDSWYDTIEAYPTVRMFTELSRHSPHQHLILGPTAHCRMGTETAHTQVGDREVGDGRFDYVSLIEQWYDRWLKDVSTPEPPPVQYYVLSASQWVSAQQWPPSAQTQRLYLRSGGRANSASGDGQLTTAPPPANEPADEYVSDPLHPVPSLGGSCCSAAVSREQSPVEARADVLVYTTPVISAPLRIVGEISAQVYVSSSAPDTDLMLKLVDVYPNGSAYNLGDTALRLRYRSGARQPSRLVPGVAYPIEVTGLATAAELAAGHRLRIEIASANFPNYERNLQTGGANFNEAQPQIARNRIWHDAKHVSYLVLPVASRSSPPQ